MPRPRGVLSIFCRSRRKRSALRLPASTPLGRPARGRSRLFCYLLVPLICLLFSCTGCSRHARESRALARADKYFNHGQYDQAKIEYLKALRLDPGAAAAYSRLGAIWFEEGLPLRAAPFLLKCRELTPNDLDNRIKLARVFLSVGRRDDAIAEALAVLQRLPTSGDAIRVLAEAAQSTEDFARLEDALQHFPKPDEVQFQLARATLALHRKDHDTAERSIQEALTLNSKSAPAHAFMGMYALMQKDLGKARGEFKMAAELAGPRSLEHLQYAELMAQSGALDEAIGHLKAIVMRAPDYVPAWNGLAGLALRRNSYDECLKLLQNTLNRDPDNFDGRLLQAKAWVGKSDAQRAIDSLEDLDKKYPKFPPLKVELAECYLRKNNSVQASELLNEAIAANPDFIPAAILLAQLNLRTGNAPLVVDSMKKLLEKHPNTGEARLLLADAYRILGRLDEAAQIFRDQIRIAPQEPQAYIALGIILRQQKKTDEARSTFEHALELAPQSALAVVQLVDLEIAAGNLDKAFQLTQQQVSRNPGSALAHVLQGKVYATQRNWDAAEAALNKSLALDPGLISAYDMLASVYLTQNKLPQATQQLESLVKRTPKNVRALMTLAMACEKLGNFGRARTAYEQALAQTPDFPAALNNLAYLDAEHFNELDRAYDLAHKASTLQPDNPAVNDTLGWVLYKKGDYAQAVRFLQESAAKSPNELQVLYHAGMAQYMMGQKDAARADFEQALNLSPDPSLKGEIERRLQLVSDQTAGRLSLADLKLAITQHPDDAIARFRLGEAYEKNQEWREAADNYEQLIKRNPHLVSVLKKLAEIYAQHLHDNGKALGYAKDARELAPNDPTIAVLLGRLAYQTGNPGWAYSLLKESVGNSPDDPTIAHDLAWAAYSLGKVAEAKEDMKRVADHASGSPEALDAKSFLAMSELAENAQPQPSAEQEAAALLRTNPQYVPAEMVQAKVAAAGGDGAKAAAIYENILSRWPDFTPAQTAVAMLYAREGGNIDRAYELASKARKAAPDDPNVAQLLAEVSYRKEEYSRAIQLFEETEQKRPLQAKDLYYLAMSCLKTKQNAQARTAFDRALAAGLPDPFATEARQALHNLAEK